MNTKRKGALPCQMIHELIGAGAIRNVPNIENVQPASLDLTLSGEIYEIDSAFLPRIGESVKDSFPFVNARDSSLDSPLKIGHTYIARLNERFDLPESIYGYANPKSSTGRTDTHVRLLSDGFSRYDGVPVGYEGGMWLVIIPKSFNIQLKKNIALNQMRFFNTDTRFDHLQLELTHRQQPLIWDPENNKPIPWNKLNTCDKDGSVILSVDLARSAIGWKARKTDSVLDFSNRKHSVEDFWETINQKDGRLILDKDAFYILSTFEGIRIPPDIASEIAPMDERSGEFRAHYAGFFDPGWGWGMIGEGVGDTATLEVRAYEPICIRHRDPVARFKFEQMASVPDVVYAAAPSNYANQSGARLSKHFK